MPGFTGRTVATSTQGISPFAPVRAGRLAVCRAPAGTAITSSASAGTASVIGATTSAPAKRFRCNPSFFSLVPFGADLLGPVSFYIIILANTIGLDFQDSDLPFLWKLLVKFWLDQVHAYYKLFEV